MLVFLGGVVALYVVFAWAVYSMIAFIV